jgi:hypothetical protein
MTTNLLKPARTLKVIGPDERGERLLNTTDVSRGKVKTESYLCTPAGDCTYRLRKRDLTEYVCTTGEHYRSCTCKGYTFRGGCRHLSMLEAAMFHGRL